MKKIILIALMAVGFLAANAATVSSTVPSATSKNIAFALGTNTPAVITAITVVSTNNNVATVAFYDSFWKTFQITNQAYTTITSYATNMLYNWTNYYGVSNGVYMTNTLVDITNSVATNNILLTPVFVTFAGTNSSVTYSGLSLRISQGLWLTNTTAASDATVSITYGQ